MIDKGVFTPSTARQYLKRKLTERVGDRQELLISTGESPLRESDKRLDHPNEIEITLAHSRDSFTVPPNLYIIGTMNTADRSIALVDAALRRRFRFLSFPPNYSILIDHHNFQGLEEMTEVARISSDPYQSLVALSILAIQDLNETIVDTPDLGKGEQIGHSYLMNLDEAADIVDTWKFEILPLLEEYYFGQFDRIRDELFQTEGGRLFQWDTEEIADFTRNDLSEHAGQVTDPDYWIHPDFDNKRLVESREEIQSGSSTTMNE
jgi:5-methylcytosine-specific restriction protein B